MAAVSMEVDEETGEILVVFDDGNAQGVTLDKKKGIVSAFLQWDGLRGTVYAVDVNALLEGRPAGSMGPPGVRRRKVDLLSLVPADPEEDWRYIGEMFPARTMAVRAILFAAEQAVAA